MKTITQKLTKIKVQWTIAPNMMRSSVIAGMQAEYTDKTLTIYGRHGILHKGKVSSQAKARIIAKEFLEFRIMGLV